MGMTFRTTLTMWATQNVVVCTCNKGHGAAEQQLLHWNIDTLSTSTLSYDYREGVAFSALLNVVWQLIIGLMPHTVYT